MVEASAWVVEGPPTLMLILISLESVESVSLLSPTESPYSMIVVVVVLRSRMNRTGEQLHSKAFRSQEESAVLTLATNPLSPSHTRHLVVVVVVVVVVVIFTVAYRRLESTMYIKSGGGDFIETFSRLGPEHLHGPSGLAN